MPQTVVRLRPGDLVEVKAPEEILRTLDVDGTSDQLPFMPEMVEFCGRRFQVAKRVLKTCYYTKAGASGVRRFRSDDVVLLESLRCSGAEHDGCQKACMIFWRESWLRKVDDAVPQSRLNKEGRDRLRAHLKTSTGPKTYFCQASEILRATTDLSQRERVERCLAEVREGNCSAPEMAQRIGSWLYWRTRRALLGEYARGSNTSTPMEGLNLQAGEAVQVKSVVSITTTLNEASHNRGLYFTPDMRVLCGRQGRVEKRIDKIIVDGTGEMRELRNTVYLEGSHCGCIYALGGCPRGEFSYWREIWLRRPD
jgi:hypothetical protein